MNPDPLTAAYLSEAPGIGRYMRSKIVNFADADDIAAAMWERQVIAIARTPDMDLSPAWIMTCARNAVIDYYRRGPQRSTQVELADTLPAHHNTERTATDAAVAEHVLRLLPPRWATVLRLRYLEEFTIEETAELMGIPEGSVKSAASLAKAAARVLLGVDPVPPPRTFPHRNRGRRCKHD